jgi:hypothetical protein
MTRRTLVIRRNGCLLEPRAAQRLLERLVAEPGVEAVRVEAAPLCVTLRVDPALAQEGALRGLVHAQPIEHGAGLGPVSRQAPGRPSLPSLLTRAFA